MSVTQDPRVNNIIQRAQAIITKPAPTWDTIAAETTTIKDLYLNYALILAAIPAVAGFLGKVLFLHPSFANAIEWSIAEYVMNLIGLGVLAMLIDFLAPKFQGQQNQINAFKLAIYSMTPVFVAGVLDIVPQLAPLVALAGLYSFYVLYLGTGKLMKTPYDKSTVFTIVVVLASIVIMAVISTLLRV